MKFCRTLKEKKGIFKKRYRRKLYLLNYFDEQTFIELPYSSTYIVKIIEWAIFKMRFNVDQPNNSNKITLKQIVLLLTKYYNAVEVNFNRSRILKYKSIPHVDEAFISFFYFDKLRVHYDRTLYRRGINKDLLKFRVDKANDINE